MKYSFINCLADVIVFLGAIWVCRSMIKANRDKQEAK